MAKTYTLKDFKNFKRLSSLAAIYIGESGKPVSHEYMRQLKKKYKFQEIEIDGIIFYDLTTLPDEIKKNLKKA